MYVEHHCDGAPTLAAVCRVISAMRWKDLRDLAEQIEATRSAPTGRSARRLTDEDIHLAAASLLESEAQS